MLLICQLICTSVSASIYKATRDLKLKSGAGTKYGNTGKLKKGETVEITETKGQWVKVGYGEEAGYVQMKFLEEIPDVVPVKEEPKPGDDDPYEELDTKTMVGLGVFLLGLVVIRKVVDIFRKRKAAKNKGAEVAVKLKPSFWYVCKHCNHKLRSSGTPPASFCLKAESHHWLDLGLAGKTNYHCKNCSVLVTTEARPPENDCTGAEHHSWNNLGEMGDRKYRCRSCGLVVFSDKVPNNTNCREAEVHTWIERH